VKAVLLALALLASAVQTVEIECRQRISREPATIRVRVRVEPRAEHRALFVSADSGSFYRSSAFQLEGERAAATHWIEWRDLPAGDYELLAQVSSATRVVARAKTTITVVGRVP
jgi:hypothetical protein